MCKHDVINIQHAHCGLVGLTARSSSKRPLPATGIRTRQVSLPQPGSDVEQPQLMCKYDVIHKTGNT